MAIRKIIGKSLKPSYAYLIEKKCEGGEFTEDEVRNIVDSILDDEMPDYQMAALIMAIFFKDMAAGNALSSAVCAVQELVEEEAEPPPDGFKPEVVHAQFTHGDVTQLGRVVHGTGGPPVRHRAAEEDVDGMDQKAGIQVGVGQGEEEFRARHVQPRLFFHLAGHSLLAALEAVAEAARQVERPLARVFPPAADQQLVAVVHDDGYCGCAGVEIISEAAVFTMLRFLVVLHEARRAALGAEAELGERMFVCHSPCWF